MKADPLSDLESYLHGAEKFLISEMNTSQTDSSHVDI